MPAHDWTQVDAGIFHDFHCAWIDSIKRALNKKLPPDYYALAEQVAGGLGPDVLTLQHPSNGHSPANNASGTATLTSRPPRTKLRFRSDEAGQYATKARAVVIRHTSNHRVIAVVEIVSPGNKGTSQKLSAFVNKATDMLNAGIHLLILDLFPPSVRDPQGIHQAIWEKLNESDFELPADQPLTLVAYRADRSPEAFVEPIGVGQILPEMPVFLEPEAYLPLELEPTYQSAWEAVPRYWQEVIQGNRV